MKKKNDNAQIIKLLLIIIIPLIIVFVVPSILYFSKPRTNINDFDGLFKNNSQNQMIDEQNTDEEVYEEDEEYEEEESEDIEFSPDETIEEQQVEDKIEQKQLSGENVDKFYPLILKQLSKQKNNQFVVIPYDYVPSNNYMKNAADDRGAVHIYKKNPIKVYIPKGEYFDAMNQAFVTYNYEFKGLFAFQRTNNPKEADIKVVISDDFSLDTDVEDAIGLGSPTKFDMQGNIEKSEIKILNKNLVGYKKVPMTRVYNVMLHEIGHAIGIMGHSQDENDVLYAALTTDDEELSYFSERDKETIKLLYSKRKDLIANQLQGAQKEKLKENIFYAEKTNNSDSYLSVADSYYYAQEYDKAVQAYAQALKLNPNNPRIYTKLSACYIVAKNYDAAIRFALLALKKSKTNEQIAGANHYIAMAYEAKDDVNTALEYRHKALNALPSEKAFFMAYIYSCFKLHKKNEARIAYTDYISNYDNSSFSEYENLLMSWVKSD